MSYICRFMFASLWFVNIQQKGKIGEKRIYIKIWPKVKLNHGNVFESAVCSVHCIHVCMCNALLRTKKLFSVVNFSSYPRFLLIQVIFVDNFSLHRPFCDLVSFVEYTIEKHTLRPFLISICYPFVSSSQNMNCDCYLLLFFCSDRNANSEEEKKECLKNRKYCELYVSFIFYFSQNKCSEPQKNPYNSKRKICMGILSRFCCISVCAVRTVQCAFIYNGFVSFGHARLCPVSVNNKIRIFS